LNPAYPEEKRTLYLRLPAASGRPGHIWCATSGSTVQKWVGLSKEAVLASAAAVNFHLQSTASDRWVSPLPVFHVGGLGLFARAYLSGAEVITRNEKWDAGQFYHFLKDSGGTLTALVPTQLHDFVQLQYTSPPGLRAVVIGGGGLNPEIYKQAVQLGWPVLPSYGLTECASQVATAELGSWKKAQAFPPLRLLSHMQAKTRDGRLSLKSSSLLTTYAYFNEQGIQFSDPKEEGWFFTEDRGEVIGSTLKVHGRHDSCIKIGGETVDRGQLETFFQTACLKVQCRQEAVLAAVQDARLGQKIVLAVAGHEMQSSLEAAIAYYQKNVLPFEKIREVVFIQQIPRTSLGKVQQNTLSALLKQAEEAALFYAPACLKKHASF
jgi:O-succinylbenzoic acid--CoA ligase